MFKGKVTIIKNINGKEEKIEKEFDSQDEYLRFMAQNNAGFADPSLSLSEWGALGDFVDRIFETRFANFLPDVEAPQEEVPVDVAKYEQEAKKIETEKKAKESKKENIKKAISKLKDFVKTFEKEGKKDLAKSAKEDIKKLEKELKNIK